MCKYCGEQFSKTQSVGGHVSKKHPGMSVSYRKKQDTRAENENDRKMRSQAKKYLFDKTKKNPALYR